MKKRILVFVLALAMAFNFAACATTAAPGAEAAATPGQEPGPAAQAGGGANPDAAVTYAGAGMDATVNANVTAFVSQPPAGMADTAAGDGKTLTIAQGGEPNYLYPAAHNSMTTAVICQQLYEPLFRYNCFTDEYEGLLAEDWEFIDDTCLRVYLRQGVLCHAGYEMTADDVLWSIEQGYNSSTSNWIWGYFNPEKCKVIDKYTIDICTDEPFGPWFTYLSNWSVGGITNRRAYEEQTPEDYSRNPTGGSGPYAFVEWIAGDRIVLKRFEDYYGDKPYYENLIIRNIPDDTTRTLSLEGGEVDCIITCDTGSIQNLKDSPACNVYEMPSWQIIYCGLNFRDEGKPWADKRVRDAMYHAIDIDTIAPLAFDGSAIRADGYMPPSQPSYAPPSDPAKIEYNVEKAKALMKEAGYENGFSIRLYTIDTPASWARLAEMVQNAWEAIGIDVALTVYDSNAHWDLVYSGDFDAFIARHTSHGNDGNYMHQKLISWGTGSSNPGRWNSPAYDELMEAALHSNDEAYRMECYHKVNDLIREEKPWIPLACPTMTYACRSTLQGVYPSAAGLLDARFLRPITVP